MLSSTFGGSQGTLADDDSHGIIPTEHLGGLKWQTRGRSFKSVGAGAEQAYGAHGEREWPHREPMFMDVESGQNDGDTGE